MSVGMVYGFMTADLNSADPLSFYRSVDGMSLRNSSKTLKPVQILPLWPLLFLTISLAVHYLVSTQHKAR